MSPSVKLLERRFEVEAPLETVWDHLQKIAEWPSWARHIRRIDIEPSGPISAQTRGTIRLTNGVRSIFRMEELNPGVNWLWVGPFLWLWIRYDHRFRELDADRTEIEFVLHGEGFGVRVFGRLFAAIYGRNLDRAIPLLTAELESPAAGG